jgi:hypothetical protein
VEQGVCWAAARRLETLNNAQNAMDLGPKFINAFQGEPGGRCEKLASHSRKGRKRWYYDLRHCSTENHYPIFAAPPPTAPLANDYIATS